jgi:pentatricopeptide repeat protein
MQDEGITPDDTTLLCVLSACGHSGLLNVAEEIFGDMAWKYSVIPNLAHHTCMVVIFGRAGYFEKAVSIIRAMPLVEDSAVWLALLSACRKWGNVKLGKLTFDQVIQLNCNCAPAYVHMANLFASAGMREDSVSVKDMGRRLAACGSSES